MTQLDHPCIVKPLSLKNNTCLKCFYANLPNEHSDTYSHHRIQRLRAFHRLLLRRKVVSGFSCIGVRLCFLALQRIFVQHSGTLPAAAAALSPLHRMLTPACGGLLAMLVLRAARHYSGSADPVDYVEAVRFRGGRIPLLSTVWRTASSACSIATGAAVGREGSMIQFAAAISSWLAERLPVLRFSISRQVACGVAAGVAAAYQAPIAGAFFSLEIVLGEWRWPDLLPVTMASS
jgi:chloride channel protein, CIC family